MTKFKTDYGGITPVLNLIINCRNILTNVITNLHRQQTEAKHFVVKGQNVINEASGNMTIAPLHVVCFIKTKMTLDAKPDIETWHVTYKDCVGTHFYFGYFGRYFLPFYLVKWALNLNDGHKAEFVPNLTVWCFKSLLTCLLSNLEQ